MMNAVWPRPSLAMTTQGQKKKKSGDTETFYKTPRLTIKHRIGSEFVEDPN